MLGSPLDVWEAVRFGVGGVSLLAPEHAAHDYRGEYGRGGGDCALEDRLEDVVFDPALLRNVYEAFGQLVAYEVGYPGRHRVITRCCVASFMRHLSQTDSAAIDTRVRRRETTPEGTPV